MAHPGAYPKGHGTTAKEASPLLPVAPAEAQAGASLGFLQEAGQPAKVEEDGDVSLVVESSRIQADLGQLAAITNAYGGFVANTTTQSADAGSPAEGSITLKIPEEDFGAVLTRVEALGKVASLSTSATDVTGQYVNLQEQITALEGSRRQYLTIMAKATTIGGVLAVQEQLDNIESQLDQLKGQLNVIENETTYATLIVTLSAKVPPPLPAKVPSGFERAWKAALSGFVAGWEGVVRVAGPLAFAILLLASLWFGGRFVWKLARRRTAEE